MQSTCPSCKNQIEHEDFLFEVVCDKCRTRFNPFMQQMDLPAEGIPGLTPAAAEPSEMAEPPGENFAESNAVFQELRQFGETLEEPAEPKNELGGAEPGAVPSAKSASSARSAPVMVAVATDCAITTGDTLQGYVIEAYLEPVSVLADLEAGAPDPLKSAFEQLSGQAKNQGGNGMLGMRWALSPDMTKCLISGIPVRCTKQA